MLALLIILAKIYSKSWGKPSSLTFAAKKSNKYIPGEDFGLRYDATDGEEDCGDLLSHPTNSLSFMQQISTGSNTDSDLRVIRVNDQLIKHTSLDNEDTPKIKRPTQSNVPKRQKSPSEMSFLFDDFQNDCENP